MKKSSVLFTCVLLAFMASCKKEETVPENVSIEKILLKDGKAYPKDSIFNEMSLLLNVSTDTLIYKESERSVYIKAYNHEVNPVIYLSLKNK